MGLPGRGRKRWFVLGSFLGALVILLAVAIVVQAGITASDAPAEANQPVQPLFFSHQKHVEAGAQCVFCHAGVLNGPVAGLPSMAKCIGCHQNVQVSDEKDQPDVDRLMQMWEEGQPLRWPKINDQPDFVYFSHRPHVTNGVSCETCHGDVSRMDLAQPAYDLNMGFCLDCHRRQAPEKVQRLIDCKACHK